jgi:hypothetical protein
MTSHTSGLALSNQAAISTPSRVRFSAPPRRYEQPLVVPQLPHT